MPLSTTDRVYEADLLTFHRTLIEEWNEPEVPFQWQGQSVIRTPDTCHVIEADEKVTYHAMYVTRGVSKYWTMRSFTVIHDDHTDVLVVGLKV